MYEYLNGPIVELTPTQVVIECGGIGYDVLISLQTYDALQGKERAKVYLYYYVREDERQFYGFATKEERELFKLIIGVNGVGVGTARMMLSSLTTDEIRNAIIGEDANKIKSVKGIGIKVAQRIIIDLKDKIIKGEGSTFTLPSTTKVDNSVVEEATTALVMLGFTKPNINKVIPEIIKKNPDIKVETLIKEALQKL